MKVYLDSFLLVNLMMNFFMILIVSLLRRHKVKWYRMLMGSTLGALYSIFYFLPFRRMLLSWPMRLLVMAGMIIVTFMPDTWGELIRLCSYFVICAFAAAGVILGLGVMYSSGQLSSLREIYTFNCFSAGWLVFAIVLLVSVGGIVWRHVSANAWRGKYKVSLLVCFGGEQVVIPTLVDTGNRLTDPISKKPVIIVRHDMIASILPKDFASFLSQCAAGDFAYGLRDFGASPWSTRCSIIPYNSVGKSLGLLIAFRPDHMILEYSGSRHVVSNALIGVVSSEMLPEEGVAGLMHPQILQNVFA